MNPDFTPIFARLRQILEPYAGRFKVTADAPDHYCIEVTFNAKLGKGFPVAWVRIDKNYVSYHYMPVYMFPKLRDGMSDALQARMQGKSCFNFKTLDEPLFKELEKVTADGFDMGKKAEYGPG